MTDNEFLEFAKETQPETYRQATEEVRAEELALTVKATLAIEGIFV